MTWKDTTIILNQTFSDTDIERVKREAKNLLMDSTFLILNIPLGKWKSPALIPNGTTIRKNINGKELISSSVSKVALRQPDIKQQMAPKSQQSARRLGNSKSFP